MTEKERKEYREFLSKEYFIKTGISLLCIEHNEKHPNKYKKICAENILTISAKYWNISVDDLQEKSRRRSILYKRRMTVAVMRTYGMSYTDIGNMFYQDHTTIMWGTDVHTNLLETDEDYRSSWVQFNDHCIAEINKIQNAVETPAMLQQPEVVQSKTEIVTVDGDYINIHKTRKKVVI